MSPEVLKRVGDAHAACAAIADFIHGLDLAEFTRNALVRSAVERQFEIVGEALSRAAREDASLDRSIPELPRIIGLRNRLIHGYDAVDARLLWDVATNKAPALRVELQQFLDLHG